jgi:CheY-like chemotaxis protein
MSRILLVEDEPELREPLTEILERDGHLVSSVSNGLEALRAARSAAPDVIVLDLMMPVMNGWEFLHVKRSDPELAAIPVILVSAVEPPRDLGPLLCLSKPYEVRALLRAIQRIAAAVAGRPPEASLQDRTE